MTRNKKYLYIYYIIEITKTDQDMVQNSIATYLSNAAPPQIGSVFVPGEFSDEPVQEYEVVSIVTRPEKATELNLDDISDVNHIRVLLKKIKNSL